MWSKMDRPGVRVSVQARNLIQRLLHTQTALEELERAGGDTRIATKAFNLAYQALCSYLAELEQDAGPGRGC